MGVPRCRRCCVHRLLTAKALAGSSSCSYIAKPRRLLRRTASNVLRNIPEQDPDAKRAAPIDRRKAQPFVIREIASRGLVSSRAPPRGAAVVFTRKVKWCRSEPPPRNNSPTSRAWTAPIRNDLATEASQRASSPVPLLRHRDVAGGHEGHRIESTPDFVKSPSCP